MGARGEQTIIVGDEEIRVLFTNRALAEAEQALGKGIFQVFQEFVDQKAGLTDTVHLLRAGMEAARRDARTGGKAVQTNDAYDVLNAVGFQRVIQAVAVAIADVLAYDPDQETDPNQ